MEKKGLWDVNQEIYISRFASSKSCTLHFPNEWVGLVVEDSIMNAGHTTLHVNICDDLWPKEHRHAHIWLVIYAS